MGSWRVALVVDDTMRASPPEASLFGIGDSARNSVLMVAAAGTLVARVRNEWRAKAGRSAPHERDVGGGGDRSGDGRRAAERQRVAAASRLPDGVVLLRELSVESENPGSMRAHLCCRRASKAACVSRTAASI